MHARTALIILIPFLLLGACKQKPVEKDEQLRIPSEADVKKLSDSTLVNAVMGNLSFAQMNTSPVQVIMTGLPEHRLLSIYKSWIVQSSRERNSYYADEEPSQSQHFFPGIDLLYGYNLVNLADYNLKTAQLHYLFDHPVLIKNLYYPSEVPDSLFKKPINRNYMMVSVYDGDTNKDSVINRKDLRKLYRFNFDSNERIQLIPDGYSIVKAQYDKYNDLVYIFAKKDENKNGQIDKKEPTHVFYFSLSDPALAKLMY